MSPPTRRLAGLAIAALAAAACTVQPLNAPSQSGTISEPVRIVHGAQDSTTVLVSVTINGRGPFTFALDTGASTSLVDSGVASQVGLTPVGRSQSIQGIGGVERANPVRPKSWNAGSIKLPVLTIFAAQLPTSRRGENLQGLLGSDVWNGIGRFTLDYRAGTLTVSH
jgi:Aspartyl protease